MCSSGLPAKRWLKASFLALFSFFITIEKIELKNAAGEWVTVIRPDRRLDLEQEEPTVRFFNNGRIAPGEYGNVRVTLTEATLERKADFSPPLSIKQGSFVNVSFLFDLNAADQLNEQTVRQVSVTVDQDERTDKGDTIKVWS